MEREYTHEEVANQSETLAKFWEGTHDEAERELEIIGFKRIPQPVFTCPELDPKALTNMNLSAYAEVHIRFTAWLNYAENTLAYAQSMLVGVKRQISQLSAQLQVLYGGVKNPETGRPYSLDARKLMVENNPRYIELLRDQTKLESLKVLSESQVASLSKSAALVSRHIEIRKLEVDSQHRNHNMPGRGMYPNQ